LRWIFFILSVFLHGVWLSVFVGIKFTKNIKVCDFTFIYVHCDMGWSTRWQCCFVELLYIDSWRILNYRFRQDRRGNNWKLEIPRWPLFTVQCSVVTSQYFSSQYSILSVAVQFSLRLTSYTLVCTLQ